MISSKCPFINRVSSTFMRKAGGSLGIYSQSCPVMSGVMVHTAAVRSTLKPSSQQSLGKARNCCLKTKTA